jgi:hydroxymethylpyrimidine/phosphomethylpyrimidine kinase
VAAYVALGDNAAEAERKARDFVARGIQPKQRPQGVGEKLYNRFIALVTNHYRTNSDVAFYADCLNVSPTYLAQVCHRVSGLSPKNIIDRQMTKAIGDELLSTDKTVQEIAFDNGFSSQAHFSKFFKKQTGLSPSDYRRQTHNKQL